MKRRVCVVSGTRAEYGLLRWLMAGLQDAPDIELQTVVTGMHLSPEFGMTYREIEADGFAVTRRVEMLLSSDTPAGIAKSTGLGMIGFADAFADLSPDLVILLGDRFEILAAATAAMLAQIPIAHLHGGETTEGAFDEAIRHSITKMSQLHFVAAEPYRRRVIQLGEDPSRVFLVGGLGIDGIKRTPLLDRDALEASLDFSLGKTSLLITFHPVTLDGMTSLDQLEELLAALGQLTDTRLVFTKPNADTESRALISMIDGFVATHENARAYTSLGQRRYLSCMQFVDGVVGNSSSGLTEAPTFKVGTIDIGDRQRGRLKAASVISCAPKRADIRAALEQLRSPEFQRSLANVSNPYGEGGASERIVEVVRNHPLDRLVKKSFYDLEDRSTATMRGGLE